MGAGGVGDDHNKGKRKRNSAYSQDTMKEEPKRTRVHAQRKFAQGAGGISVSPQVSPLKEIRSRSVKNDNASSSSSSSSGASFPVSKGERPKTEDFLTFLCLRGTDLLPPELDFFNQASTASHNNESSDECSSDQDDVNKDPEVDKNGVARKSSKRLSAINCNSKLKKESSPSLRKRENVDSKKDLFRKTRSASQDSHSSPERKSEVRQTRSQGVVSKLELKPHIKPGVARKNGCSIESSEESLSDNEVDEGFDAEVDADEDASSRESSRRPMTRKADELRLKGKDSLTKLKERERRSTSRDSSVSKESIKPVVLAGKSKMSKSKNATPVKENQDAKSDKEESCRDETSKSPKDKRETKKKHKNKSKTSLKDLQNILLEEAKRKIQADVPADSTDAPQETSENSSKQPSCSPPDSDAAESDERITISQKTGYINVKPRSSVDQIAEEATVEPGGSPKRRNSGPLAGPGGKKIIKANERVPTPPRKILPKNDSEVASSESTSIGNRTNHLPVGVIGAAGLSNRMTHPVALSKSSPVSSSTNFSQPLTIQTTTSSQSKPVMTVGSMSQSQINVASMSQPPSQPTIIVPAGPNTGQTAIRMPIQVSAVPLQVNMGMRPTAGGTAGPGYSNMQGIPIITPTGMQFGIPVGAGSVQNIQNNLPVTMPSLPTQPTPMSTGTSLQIRPQQTGGQPPVVTVPTFIRSGYGYSQQPIVASVAPGVSSVASLPPPQTITMPSGTTIQYNVPSSSIKHNNPSTKISAVAQSPLPISTNSSPLVSPGPPTLSPQQRPPVLSPQVPVLSPQVPGSQRGSTTVTKTMAPGPQPPVLTPPVRQEVEPKARREILGSSSSPSSQHSPSMAPLAPQTMLSQQQHCTYPGPGSYHSPPYQQPSPVGSYHSPQGLQQQGPMHSPPYQQHPHQSPPYQQASPVGSYHSPAGSLHSPGYHGHMSPMYQAVSPQVQYSYQTSQQQQVVYPQQQHQHPMLQSPQDVAMPPQEPIRPPSQPQSESSSLHSPLLPSSASSAQMSLSKKKKESSDKKPESPKDEVIVVSDNRSESSECSSTSSTQKKKKTGDRMLKSKFGSSKARQTKTFDVEDNSSPYAFDFDNPESESPNIPFRKSSSPLKPPAMIKKSLMASKYKKTEEPQAHDDLKPTGSKHKTAGESQKSPKKKPDLDRNVENDGETNLDVDESKAPDNPEDTSSSDNETTYFIPLKNSSGQSFGVALKLGTDGPCGPNQKVIMTAKLVTDPATKPTKAKILGAKTTETSLPAREPASPVQSTSTPIKENMTPRKMMNANSSPVTYDDKSRIRRALSPDPAPSLPSTSSSKDTSFVGGKRRPMCLIGNVNTGHRFPRLGQHAQMMEAPTFRPSEDEFKDPLKYIQKIRGYAEQFGMCRIIPPSSFKPECNVDDDMRFTAYNQYINRMMSRSGQNSKETAAIKKYLETQNCDTRNHPLVGGLEVDLPALYHAVQSFGGLSEVIQKKKWTKIADYMRVARGTNINAAANKLDDVYVKWLLPYDTLSNVEREELIRLIEEEWAEKAEKSRVKEETGSDVEDNDDEEEDEDEDQEAVVKGKSTSLTQFYRVAKNLMSSIFRSEDPPHHIVEDEYWKIVSDKDVHLQVCQGSIDTGNEGYGFPIRNSQFSSHPWNLKQLTNNPRSVLRAMGKVMGVTQPTLHVGMLFTTGCWYRDPHGLPWVEFLHTGAPKIWYGIPDDHSLAFYTAMKQLVPSFCKNRKIWLPSDTTMVSPSYLVKHGVSVCRAVQQPGQFVVVFPRSYTSSICTGYNVSESVYYAPNQWLADVDSMFQDIRDSQEPMMFPIEKILFALASDSKATKYVLENIKSKIAKIRDREMDLRRKVTNAGVKTSERLELENKSSKDAEDEEYECYVCNANLYVSLIADEKDEVTYCLPHGLEYIKENKNKIRHCKLLYTHTLDEIKEILNKLDQRLKNKDYAEEHEEDIPLKEEDIEDIEDEDYIDEEDIKPRDRALPSYIKKEKKPMISSESEDEEEENEEAESEDSGPKITADDYLEDDVDPAVIAALFAEDDEVVRPSGKRKAPKERKVSESSESSEEEEEEETEEEVESSKKQKKSNIPDKKKTEPKSRAESRVKEVSNKKSVKEKEKEKKNRDKEVERVKGKELVKEKEKEKEKEKMKTKIQSKSSKRKLDESPPSSKQVQVKKSKDATPVKKVSSKVANDKTKSPSSSSKTISKKQEDTKKRSPVKDDVKSSKKAVKIPIRDAKKKEEPKKSNTPKVTKEEKVSTRRRESAKDDKGKQRRSKKRKAKSMDAADKFNLLDIILTETDDENYCSASDKESKESSSDDEWK